MHGLGDSFGIYGTNLQSKDPETVSEAALLCILADIPIGLATMIASLGGGIAFLGCPIAPVINTYLPFSSEAIIYFEVKPNEIIYIGSLANNFVFPRVRVKDNFDSIKEEIAKTHPEIVAKMTKKLMQKVKKPNSCNFSQIQQGYEKCIEDLKKI